MGIENAASAQELNAAAERIVDVFILLFSCLRKKAALPFVAFASGGMCGRTWVVGFRRLRETAEATDSSARGWG